MVHRTCAAIQGVQPNPLLTVWQFILVPITSAEVASDWWIKKMQGWVLLVPAGSLSAVLILQTSLSLKKTHLHLG